MTGWKEISLGELCDVMIGRQRSPKHATGSHMTPYLRSANVKDGAVLTGDILEMNFTPEKQTKYLLTYGDVLVTEGCGSAAELGASAQWKRQLPGPIAMQNTLLRLRSVPGRSDPDFLHALARWCHKSGQWLETSSGTSIRLRCSRDNLEDIRRLLLPPLVTGQIDVSSLDLDALVESVA
jgi:type I restriction enzyme S subunit